MKKVFSLILCAVMVFGVFATVNADGELAGAKSFILGSNLKDSISYGKTAYSFEMSSAGKFTINLYSNSPYLYLCVYDKMGNRLWSKTVYDNDTTQEIHYNDGIYLCAGTYYIVIENTNKNTYQFELKLSETPIYESFFENQGGSNNSTKTASLITRGKQYVGCLAINDKTDIYKFELNQSGIMSLDLFSEMPYIYAELFNEDGTRLWSKSIYDNDTTHEIKFQTDFYLCKGNYYFSLTNSDGKGGFNFKFIFKPSFETFTESQTLKNDQTTTANPINMNQQYNGQFALNDKVDVYKINITSSNPNLVVTGKTPYIYAELFDENGKRLWSKSIYDNDTTKEIKFSDKTKTGTGIHYLSLSNSNGNGFYSFNLNNGGKVTESNNTLGSVINQALRTDITAKINGHAIPSFNVDGYTYIVAEDLKYYGFAVTYDNDARSLSLTRDYSQTWVSKNYVKPYVPASEVGVHECHILLTDIVTYFDGMYTDSYNINGQTIIRFDALAAYGAVSYDNNIRTISLSLPGIN